MTSELDEIVEHPAATPRPLPRRDLDIHVAHIVRISRLKALEAVVEIGAYILQAFYDGDIERFRSRKADHMTLDLLVAHPDMTLSRSTLYTAVAVAHQVSELPPDVALELQPSHHRKLLAVKDVSRKAELARLAVTESWTVAKLTEQIRPAVERTRGGRSPEATLSRCLASLENLQSILGGAETLSDIAGTLSDRDAQAGLQKAHDAAQDVVRRLRELLAVARSRNRLSDPPYRSNGRH